MTVVALRAWLKVADPTAYTALDALRRALGYGDRVRGLIRSEIWCLGFSQASAEAARGTVERLARETNLLVNPNKHAWETVSDAQALSPRGTGWILVSVPGAGAGLSETLTRHDLVGGDPPRSARATLWELDLLPEGDAGSLLEEMAVVRDRGHGLLANPHVENAVTFVRPPSAEDLARALDILP